MPRDLRLATATQVPPLLVVVPVGSMEQHCNLPIGLDCLIAERLAWEACGLVEERGGVECWVAPPLCYGYSPEWAATPGTISIHLKVFIDLVEEVVRSLALWGVKRIIVLNGHGGNTGALRAAVAEAVLVPSRDFLVKIIDYWRVAGIDLGHASPAEAAVAEGLGIPLPRRVEAGCEQARASEGPATVMTRPRGRLEVIPSRTKEVDVPKIVEAVAEEILDALTLDDEAHWVA